MYPPRISHENTFSLVPKNPYTVADSSFREAAIVPDNIKGEDVLISLWLFLFPIFPFAAQPKEFCLNGLKKLEQRSQGGI
jgi:hypothetical protein